MIISVFLFMLVLFFSCAGNGSPDTPGAENIIEPDRIYGRVSGLPGRKILLFELYGDQVNLLDSAMADADGRFEFFFPPERSRGLYRIAMGRGTLPGHYDRHRQQLDLIWDGSPVMFNTNYASPVDSMEVILSEENRLYYQYLRRMRRYDDKINALGTALLNYPPDDGFYRRLERQHRRVQNRRANYTDNLVKKYRGTIFSSIARFQKMPRVGSPADAGGLEEIRDNFFQEGHFADSVLLHTDLIPRRIIRFLSLYTVNDPDEEEQQEELILAADVIMNHAMVNEAVYYFVLEYLINGFESMDMELVTEHLTGRYLLGNICFEEGRLLDQDSPFSIEKLEEGDPVSNFSFKALDGRIIDLSGIPAEHTLLLFWGSWCHFCEDVMDDVYELYSDYRESHEGFLEVVAIGIEDDEQLWLDHIERGGYDWINYSSLKRWDCEIATDYQLIGTPTMILLDRDKRFIAEPSRVRALSRILSRRRT